MRAGARVAEAHGAWRGRAASAPAPTYFAASSPTAVPHNQNATHCRWPPPLDYPPSRPLTHLENSMGYGERIDDHGHMERC